MIKSSLQFPGSPRVLATQFLGIKTMMGGAPSSSEIYFSQDLTARFGRITCSDGLVSAAVMAAKYPAAHPPIITTVFPVTHTTLYIALDRFLKIGIRGVEFLSLNIQGSFAMYDYMKISALLFSIFVL